MKTLSIRQPWAEMIRSGQKTIELRTWQTAYRGDLLICTGQKPSDFLKQLPKVVHPRHGVWCDAREKIDEDWEYFYHFGKALFIAELWKVDPFCRSHEKASLCDFDLGYFSWHLRNIREIQHFELKGQLGFFDTPDKLIKIKP